MGSGPEDDLVLGDGGVYTSLESFGVILRQGQPASMVEPVDPSLTVRLSAFDRANVVRFAIVVPGDDFDDGDLITVGDHGFPSLGVEMVVSEVDPVLVVSLQSVVSEEPR